MEARSNTGTGEISSFFEQDHREIDALFNGVLFESPQAALIAFKEFDRRLERHIHWEEEILFPAVSKKEPHLEMGPIGVMRMEHEEIRKNKAAALKALTEENGAQAKNHAQAMLNVLKEHNSKEEEILYPACDQLLSVEETSDILRQIGSPAERSGPKPSAP
mgnify:CR=1 FL=1